MKFITMSAARKSLPSLIAGPDRAVITRNGLPAAVLVGFEEFRAMRADLLLLRDRAQLEAVDETLRAVRAEDADRYPSLLEEIPAEDAAIARDHEVAEGV